MLNEDDKNFMIEILSTELGASGSPRGDLVAAFYNTSFAEDITGENPRILAINAINLCIKDSWNHSPTWLEIIISTFKLTNVDQKVSDILERSKHKPPAAANPLNNNVLTNGSPFINRLDLRDKVDKLNKPVSNSQPILIVTGSSKSGKSYSHNFIDHFSNYYSSIFVYRYEFENDLGLEIGPERVASDLVAKMGRVLDKKPPLETNLKLYSRQLALWVLNEAAQIPAQHWFVLDNFSGDKLRTDTKDFILALTDLVTTGIFQRRCRIILIGFDSSSLTIDQALYDEEYIRQCNAEDIKKAITEVVNLSPIVLDLNKVEEFILSNLPALAQKMPEVNARLRALLLAINSLKHILGGLDNVDFKEVLINILKDLPPDKQKVPELKNRLKSLRESINEMP